ncbi:hypothetical protein [Neobacillus massiliamazoniensis]|uniref:PXO1-134 n=1 Tax=Neobacillus massiliamazoniensis TaxID=1499688 RepID=A0A0U1NRC6_9BACI|nr:hypothetical protein [Neobacillus massiliamazoniensis]CRK80292.1 pXO1-134 [Neobacillus massiliamazoniensis]
MNFGIGKVSTYIILEIILNDLDRYINIDERDYDFTLEENIPNNTELLYSWLINFDEYPKGFSVEEQKFIEQEIGEYLGGRMSIWFDDEEEIKEIKLKFFKYFGVNNGFFKLIVRIYDEMLQDDNLV